MPLYIVRWQHEPMGTRQKKFRDLKWCVWARSWQNVGFWWLAFAVNLVEYKGSPLLTLPEWPGTKDRTVERCKIEMNTTGVRKGNRIKSTKFSSKDILLFSSIDAYVKCQQRGVIQQLIGVDSETHQTEQGKPAEEGGWRILGFEGIKDNRRLIQPKETNK